MLILTKLAAVDSPWDKELSLPFDLRKKSRFKKTLDDGEEVGVFLDRGTILSDGDCLLSEDGRIVLIKASPEQLLHVTQGSAKSLTHLAYHLGNRHVSIEIGGRYIRLAADDVLRHMVEGLGGEVSEINAPFHPEKGAYGGGHSHGSEHGKGRGPVIHEFGSRKP